MFKQYKYNCVCTMNIICATTFLFTTLPYMAMKILLVIILLVVIIETFCAVFHQHNSVVEVKEEPGPGGLWQTKTRWKAHWVKHWEMRKIWIPIWRKVWGPVELKEWIPFPKPTPTRASTWALPPR